MSIASAKKHLILAASIYVMRKRETSIIPKLAVKIGKASNSEPRSWLGMQSAYDLWHAEHSLEATKGLAMGSLIANN